MFCSGGRGCNSSVWDAVKGTKHVWKFDVERDGDAWEELY